MKTLLAKFRISVALDDEAARPNQWTAQPNEPPEMRRLCESLQALDGRLKAARPAAVVPADLHRSILRAVRAASPFPGRRPWQLLLRWLPAPALACLILFVILRSLPHPAPRPQTPPQFSEGHPLAGAANALDQDRAIVGKAPAAMLAPLSNEMESLKRDFSSALEFVIASLP